MCIKSVASLLRDCLCRGAFSYVKRVTEKKGKAERAAKFLCARGKRKASALREMDLLSELDNQRILYFHDAFEKKNVLVLITELYPFGALSHFISLFTQNELVCISRRLKIQSINPNVLQSSPRGMNGLCSTALSL